MTTIRTTEPRTVQGWMSDLGHLLRICPVLTQEYDDVLAACEREREEAESPAPASEA